MPAAVDPNNRRGKRATFIALFLCFGILVAAAVAVFVTTGFEFDDDDDDDQDTEPLLPPAVTAPVSPPVTAPVTAPTTASPTVVLPPTPRACNGSVNLCNVPVNEVLFATMHNANADAGVARFVPNHNRNLVEGLNAGIRGLNLDIGKCNIDSVPTLSLVHGVCFLGFSDPQTVFGDIVQFLVDNPNEVILMPTQINDDSGDEIVRLQEIYSVMQQQQQVEGQRSMADLLYAHPADAQEWPTLGELIDADQRILFFQYNGAETCALVDCPTGFHDWFVYAAETDFSFQSVDEIRNDRAGSCTITRGGSGLRDWFGINLFLEIPNSDAQAILNEASFLEDQLQICAEQNGLNPNLILVDFWSIGDVVPVVQSYNEGLGAQSRY